MACMLKILSSAGVDRSHRRPPATRTRHRGARDASNLEQIAAEDHVAGKMPPHPFEPHRVGDLRVGAGHEVRQHQGSNTGRGGHASHVLGRRVTRDEVLAQPAGIGIAAEQPIDGRRVQDFVHEHVGASGQPDDVLRVARVAGDHDRAVARVEAIGKGRRHGRMVDQRGGHAHALVLIDASGVRISCGRMSGASGGRRSS